MSNLENQENIVNDTTENSDKIVGSTESIQDTTEVVEATDVPVNQEIEGGAEENKSYVGYTREELVNELQELLKKTESAVINDIKGSVEAIKQTFYRLHKEKENPLSSEDGEDTVVERVVDSVEETFKQLLGKYKEMKASANALLTEEKEKNLKLKEEILAKLEELTNSTDDLSTTIPAFRKLQQEWKAIGQVPQKAVNEIWKTYNKYQEKFYDLIKINNELREYDFKKNLEKKTQLCEAAEKLADESDVISAFHQLQDLHQEYRETGPVEKELREQVWQRFKAASTIINKRHQQHFEEIRAEEEDNLVKKTALCEKIEGIVKQERKNSGDWDNHSKEIIALQQEWKTIGFTPQKMNTKIFERFRAACDEFFTKKGEYFKELKDKYAENAKRKQELVAKAQELKDSTDWKKTSDKLIALQKEWKTIGMVPKRLGDQLWEDFLTACNHFFEARNAVHADERNEERENLAKKNEIIEKLKQLAEGAVENLQEEMRKLTDEFNKIGHVPFKEKDKMFKEYHDILDKLHKTLNVKASRHRMDNFRNNLKKVAQRGENAIDNERGRLMRRFEQLKQEINTYENNIGFLNISSKKGNSLIDDMNRRVQKLKDELAETKQKIKTIDDEKKA